MSEYTNQCIWNAYEYRNADEKVIYDHKKFKAQTNSSNSA